MLRVGLTNADDVSQPGEVVCGSQNTLCTQIMLLALDRAYRFAKFVCRLVGVT
jgi:hypothetical protein